MTAPVRTCALAALALAATVMPAQAQDANITLPIGAPGQQLNVPVPVVNVGPITAGDNTALNVVESYSVDIVRGGERFFVASGQVERRGQAGIGLDQRLLILLVPRRVQLVRELAIDGDGVVIALGIAQHVGEAET